MKYQAATMTPAETPVDAADGYVLVRDLVFHQVHKFRRRFGGDFDELLSQANEAFVRGHNQFITGRSRSGNEYRDSYAAEIRRWVWYTMFDLMRTRLEHRKYWSTESVDDVQVAAPVYDFNIRDWVEGLSPDARFVIELTMNPPVEVEIVAEGKGGEPRNYRSTVRDHLVATLGWNARRVCDAFEEIRRALGAS